MYIIITILAEENLSTTYICINNTIVSICFFDNSNEKIDDFIYLLMQGHYTLKLLWISWGWKLEKCYINYILLWW
jgi:hypothetical protein